MLFCFAHPHPHRYSAFNYVIQRNGESGNHHQTKVYDQRVGTADGYELSALTEKWDPIFAL